MRDGRISGAFVTADTDRDAVVAQMVGTQARAGAAAHAGRSRCALALAARGLTVARAGQRTGCSSTASISSCGTARSVGLFGLLGSGVDRDRDGAVRRLARARSAATIALEGQRVVLSDPSDGRRRRHRPDRAGSPRRSFAAIIRSTTTPFSPTSMRCRRAGLHRCDGGAAADAGSVRPAAHQGAGDIDTLVRHAVAAATSRRCRWRAGSRPACACCC